MSLRPKALYESGESHPVKSGNRFALHRRRQNWTTAANLSIISASRDWSPDHLLSVMYLLHLLVVRKDLFYEVGGFRPEFSGRARLRSHAAVGPLARNPSITCPRFLYQLAQDSRIGRRSLWMPSPESAGCGPPGRLEDHLDHNGIEGEVEFGQIEGTFSRALSASASIHLASLCILASNNRADGGGPGQHRSAGRTSSRALSPRRIIRTTRLW